MALSKRTSPLRLLILIFMTSVNHLALASSLKPLDKQQTSLENNKELSTLSLNMWASNNTVNPEQVFVKKYINHQVPSITGQVAAESLTQRETLVSQYHASFSDATVKILRQVAENEFVTTYWEFTATQTDEYLGLASTGKRISWSGVEIDRIEDHKIAESWVIWDMYSMFTQLGILKSPKSLQSLSDNANNEQKKSSRKIKRP
ncbi:ester cyclase [Shewanella surugensis]|uniref:Ester cyclase n=1 Tax=Shewanella surugensis TaxID=212020 RepID=A0ABT0LE81_9GAMM|nr:ester cyclase [Shewanella surugensis]MCL1126019.1 ester cyclase [Shewanella surugensis]